MKPVFLFFLVFFLSISLEAGTLDNIATIFNAKCGNSSCHGGNNPAASLNLSGNASSLYQELVGQNPTNVWAQQQGMKLVEAGFPDRSFLYRKINKGLYHDSTLPAGQAPGENMPTGYGSPDLTDSERELVRQWIFFNAPQTATVIDYNLLEQYYAGNGTPSIERPEPPAAGEGFQLYLGKIFLAPDAETEYIYKYPLYNAEGFEVTKIETTLDYFSHHLLFFKDRDGNIDQDNGLLEVGIFTGNSAITSDTKMVGGWANDGVLDLPAGTAYTWDQNTILKYNYHLKNYSSTSVLGAEIYMNVYTQPIGTALKEMHADFFINTNIFDYFIQPNVPKEIDLTISGNNFEPAPAGEPDSLYIFLLGGHTHKWGTDYDMWLRNSNGSLGEQVYEGFYNFDYTANQGFYDWSEPPTRIFNDGFAATTRAGGIFTTAKYLNTGSTVTNFGLTTEDEMQGFFCQYLTGSIAALAHIDTSAVSGIATMMPGTLEFFPNPAQTALYIHTNANQSRYERISIFNANGALMKQLEIAADDKNPVPDQVLHIGDLPAGFYILKMEGQGPTLTNKFIKE